MASPDDSDNKITDNIPKSNVIDLTLIIAQKALEADYIETFDECVDNGDSILACEYCDSPLFYVGANLRMYCGDCEFLVGDLIQLAADFMDYEAELEDDDEWSDE